MVTPSRFDFDFGPFDLLSRYDKLKLFVQYFLSVVSTDYQFRRFLYESGSMKTVLEYYHSPTKCGAWFSKYTFYVSTQTR